jgi:predicted dehydrogenase
MENKKYRIEVGFMPVKLGIIGYGGMARWHHKNASKIDGVDVIAAYDIDAGMVKEAEENGLRAYSALDEFLADKDINTVLVATPNHVHKELAVASMDAGKNVIVEKPVALSVAELDEMIAASEKNHVLFTVHQNRRWDKDYRVMRKAVEDGLLGDVYTIESRVHGSGGTMYGWRAYKKYGGGMLYDWGVHLIDQILYMMPTKVESVYARLFSIANPDVDDYFKVLLNFGSSLTAQIEVGTMCMESLPRWFVCGNRGALHIDDFEVKSGSITRLNKLADEVTAEVIDTPSGPTRLFAPRPDDATDHLELPDVKTNWTEFYENVRDVIDGKAELIVKPLEVRYTMSVIEAAFKSHETGQAVKMEY